MSESKTQRMLLPVPLSLGILVVCGFVIGYGMLAFCGVHPLMVASIFVSDVMRGFVAAMTMRISGFVIILLGIVGMLITGTYLAKGSIE
jgi:hypothetical protein